MFNKLFTGIFGHFLLRSVVIGVLSGLLLLSFVLKFFDYTANDLAAEQGRTFANSTLAASSDAVFAEDYATVVEYCLNVMKVTPNIISIVYSKRNGEELIISDKQWSLKKQTLPYYKYHFLDASNARNSVDFKMGYKGIGLGFSDRFAYSKPIYISGKDWGVLTINFATSAYSASMRNFYQVVIIFTFASIFISFFLFWLSSKRIRNQINSFSVIAKTLSEGNLEVKAQEAAIGEIGLLGKAINSMAIALSEKSARLSQLVQIVEQTDDAFILFNDSFEIIFANDAVMKLIGYPASFFTGMTATELCRTLNLTSYDLVHEFQVMLRSSQHAQAAEVMITKKNQCIINIDIRLETIFNDNDSEQNFLVVLNDVTKRKQAESEIRIAATAFESQEGMMVTDANNIILRVNRAFTSITGYSAEEVIGKTPHLLSSNKHDAAFYEEMWYSLKNQGAWEGEVWNRRKNGKIYPENLTITAVKDDNGIVTNYVATLTDITMRKAAENEIQHLAFYDSLTGLPNRRLLIDRLKQVAANNARSGRGGAILFLDLDHFKTLNDTLGHDIGDLLLQQVAARLETCVREGDTVARLGGDEFVIMLENLSDQSIEVAAQAETIGEKILDALNQPYLLANHKYQSTPSIGVVLVNKQNQSPHELLKQADIAMYQAKKAGRNTLRFFDPQMQANINARVDIERELRKAIELKQLQLYYQIQIDHLGHPLGAETLIRWIHPERGLVSPFHFIPLAEETDLILPIGLWVLNTACAQLKAWEQDSVTRDLTLSINVSAKQFHQVDFVSQVQVALRQHDIDPKKLKLELTESMLLDKLDCTINTMNVLKAIGIRFSLDDFGTGYSSLQYLKILPLFELKIDQSFVRDIVNDSSDQAIVRTIIAMADTLNLTVIAEGVETEEQKTLLLNLGCNHYQGYLFDKPLPIVEFESKYIQAAQHTISLAMEQYIKNTMH